MKLHEVESAAQKTKAIAQAFERKLKEKLSRAKAAEEKSHQLRIKFKRAKKESKQARRTARRAREEADKAQKAFAAAAALAAKSEAKAAKARKKAKSKKTQVEAKTAVRAPNKSHRGFGKKRQVQRKRSGGRKSVAGASKPKRLRKLRSKNAKLTPAPVDNTIGAAPVPEPVSSLPSEASIAKQSSLNSETGEQSHET
jgi:dynactin complex subunit